MQKQSIIFRDLKFIYKNLIDDEKYSNIMNTTMHTCML